MLFARSLMLFLLVVFTILLEGCSTSASNSAEEYGTTPKKDQIKESSSSSYSGVSRRDRKIGSEHHSRKELLNKIHYSTNGLDQQQIQKLNKVKAAFIDAYYNNDIDDLPHANQLIFGSYAAMHPDKQHELAKQYLTSKGHDLSTFKDLDGIIEAMKRATEDMSYNRSSLPCIDGQQVFRRTAFSTWEIHYQFMAGLRKHLKGEYRFNDLDENQPVVADANGNNALTTGFKHDEWYFYSRGYIFRGHWRPNTDTRQDYKGQGMELGAFKTIDSGWAFGGMFGLQKINMETHQGKADALVYRAGPFVSWSNEHWSLDSLLTYGFVSMDTQAGRWSSSPRGSEWAGHFQATYTIPLDNITMGLKLIPEAYVGYRAGNIEAHDEKNGQLTRHILSSRQTGLTTRIGSGIGYTLPDLRSPTDLMLRAGLEQTFMWQNEEKDRSYHWPKTPTPESRETAVYYGVGFNHQFGADLDKLISLDYMGTCGEKSGSDALSFTYRQRY